MDTTDAFVKLRRYSRAEVAAELNIYETWLKKWVTARCVPHQRSGEERGVWFTYDDMLRIGKMLPELMTTRQANGVAEHPAEPGRPSDTNTNVRAMANLRERDIRADDPDNFSHDDLARFASLRSIQRS